jgi:ribosomal protein S18 acetylase RimI-like enzyme
MSDQDQTIRAVGADQTQAVLDVILLAFARDPMARYWWPNPSEYLKSWQPFVLALGERGFDAGTVTATADFAAAAMWLPPNLGPDPERMASMELPGDERKAALGDQLRAEINRCHPEGAYWYLWVIGVDPRRQGRGLGSALLKHTLAKVDEQGETAYLESSDPKNVPLYERHGFEVVDVIQVGDLPPLTPMLRRAR